MLCRGASYKPYNREVEQEHLRTGSLPWLEDLQLNVVLLGPKHVGKTSLTTAFTHGVYHNLDFDPHEFIYETRELVDNEIAQLKILDTRTGDENNFCLEDMATTLQVGEGFIIVYSITDRDSFESAKRFQSLLHQVRKTKDVPVVLVGNKKDLKDQRRVGVDEGRDLAFQIGCSFYECSARMGIEHVKKIFHDIVRQIRSVQNFKATLNHRKTSKVELTKKFLCRYFMCHGLRPTVRDPFL